MNPTISFVCCVESGWLEDQAVRMIESLRRWGGRFANAPVFAVSPRRGLPLMSTTLQAFESLNVKYLRFDEPTEYEWFPYLNKPRSLVIADPYITTELVCYLDADILVVNEPSSFILQDDEDFAGCVTDAVGGSKGNEDPLEPYWQYVMNVLDVKIDDFPWALTEIEQQRIRIHWNGGVFVYRHSSKFAHSYYAAATKVLQSQIGSKVCGIFFNEQVAMAVSVIQQGLRWRNLPLSHNYEITADPSLSYYSEDRFKQACIIHYHDCLWPDFIDTVIHYLKPAYPDVADWLQAKGPLDNRTALPYRTAGKVIHYLRKRQQSAYEKRCQFV